MKRKYSGQYYPSAKRPRTLTVVPIGPNLPSGKFYRTPADRTFLANNRTRGYARTGGFYGRYGNVARAMGNLPELKFFDTALSFNIDATGEVPATGQLALIPQGDTQSTRDGRQATIKSIQINAVCNAVPAAAAASSSIAYIYLILDKQCNGAAAAATDVLTSANFYEAMFNLANNDRFLIMRKWVLNFTSTAGVTTAYNNVAQQINFYKKCNIPITWSSTTGAITEIRSNNLFLLAGSFGGDDTISVAGTCRLRFQG